MPIILTYIKLKKTSPENVTSQSPDSWRASASVSPELNIMILSNIKE